MTPDSGPDNRLPEQKPKPKFLYFLGVLLLIATAREIYGAGRNTVREREPEPQAIQDGPDIVGPARIAPPSELKKAVMPVTSDVTLNFCYDNAADCGTFGTNYCATRGGVQLNVYSAGAEIPCQVTCINGEGAQCREAPPNTAPPPKKPGDVTGMQPRYPRTAR